MKLEDLLHLIDDNVDVFVYDSESYEKIAFYDGMYLIDQRFVDLEVVKIELAAEDGIAIYVRTSED